MTPYKNLSVKKSGVSAYQIDSESITVRFGKDSCYEYTYSSTGRDNIEKMKKLAIAGEGLSTFISQNETVKNGYARKWKCP